MEKKKIFDYVIIGSGPSGSVLAYQLAKSGNKIALIDRATNTKQDSNKNSFIFSPYINKSNYNYSPIFSNQLGGNSALWNCKIYLISKDEFNNDSWSFKYEELIKYSKDLAKKFQINHNHINKVIKYKGFKSSSSLREKKLGNIFDFLKIGSNKFITVFDNSSPIKMVYKHKRNDVSGVIINNIIKNKEIELSIKKSIIFCAGGLGNPNLIQNLFHNYNKNIGKNLCDHSHINISTISDDTASKIKKFSKYFILGNNNKKEKNIFIKNKDYFGGLQLDYIEDPSRILKRIYLRSQVIFSKKILNIIISYYNLLFKIVSKLLYLFKIKNKYTFEFFFSQKKSNKNFIKINKTTRDIYGLYKSDINWKLSKSDKKNYQKIIDIVETIFLSKKPSKDKFLEQRIFTGLHPSCTTISTKNKNIACVDKNLKLINFKNVYICGSSVFSSNGFTNPTWTIMTLANRLSSYLKKNY